MANHRHLSKYSKKQQILILIFVIIFIIGLIGLIFLLKNKNKKPEDLIIGIWDFDGNTEYEFQKRNVGYLKVPMNNYKFKYYIENKKITIDFEDENIEDVNYEYQIKDNTIILKNKNGNFEFHKAKK